MKNFKIIYLVLIYKLYKLMLNPFEYVIKLGVFLIYPISLFLFIVKNLKIILINYKFNLVSIIRKINTKNFSLVADKSRNIFQFRFEDTNLDKPNNLIKAASKFYDSENISNSISISGVMDFRANLSFLASFDSLKNQTFPLTNIYIVCKSECELSFAKSLIPLTNNVSIILKDILYENLRKYLTGEYVLLLNSSYIFDRSYTKALVYKAQSFKPNLIYPDEGCIFSGVNYSHYYKPDFNYYYFLSNNYLGKNILYRKHFFIEVYEQNQICPIDFTYKFNLDFLGKVDFRDVCHLDDILISRMVAPTFYKEREFFWEFSSANIVFNFLKARGEDVIVDQLQFGNKITFLLPEILPKVTIIIPTRNNLKYLRKCVSSVFGKTTYSNYDVTIVDNGSDDADTLMYIQKLSLNPRIKILRDDSPFNFSRLNNNAVSDCDSEFICFMNDDVEVISPDWLDRLISIGIHEDVGVVGPKLLFSDGSIQHAGTILGLGVADHCFRKRKKDTKGYHYRPQLMSEYLSITAACAVVRRELFISVGGFDEINLEVAFNDVDFCLKLYEKGFKNIYTPFVSLFHHESVSRGKDDTSLKRIRLINESNYMIERWGKYIQHDPFYNKNLSKANTNFNAINANKWSPR